MFAENITPFFDEAATTMDAIRLVCERKTTSEICPSAARITESVPIYEGRTIARTVEEGDGSDLRQEFCRVLRSGPGILVIEGAFTDLSVIDRSTELFRQIVVDEHEAGQGQGDHFGNNERIWNVFQKVCLRDPGLFIDYYGNPAFAIASEAWLGPHYQITAQMNNVKPGSTEQAMHRDYHLGFQSPETISRFPAHAQMMSQFLTLQGAIAHTDMPAESGPTRLLPYSHHFAAGYQAYARPEFQSFFKAHHGQLPMSKGDAIFFSPAIFHGAGANSQDKDRVANLIQISSAFGHAMETIDSKKMTLAVYPPLLARARSGALSEHQIADVVAATADGYAFPTNLDSDPPVDGNAPTTGQQLMHKALKETWTIDKLKNALTDYERRRLA